MTVSRCLRDPDSVSPKLRERIFSVAEQIGYIPNRAPDLLARATSRSIGVLVPSLTNQVFAEVIQGIEQATEPAGYHLMLAHYGYSEELEERSLASLLSYNVDGVILSDRQHTPRTLRMLETAGIPVIEIMDTYLPALQQAVGYDNQQAGFDMVKEMIRRGRRRIIYLSVRLDERNHQRGEGYRLAMLANGLTPIILHSRQRSSFSVGGELLDRVRREYPHADAIFCTNDDVAVGAYFECLRQGVAVPEEMAIAGFHGHDIGQAMSPRLASVVTPRKAIGKEAAKALLSRLRGEPIRSPIINLGYRIEVGSTLGTPGGDTAQALE